MKSDVAYDRLPGFHVASPSALQRTSEETDTANLMLATAWIIAGTHFGTCGLAIYLGQYATVALHGSAGLGACAFGLAITSGVSLGKIKVAGVVTILAGMCAFLFVYPGPGAVFVYTLAPIPVLRILGLRGGAWATAGFVGIAVVCLGFFPPAKALPLAVRVNTLITFFMAAAFGYWFERSRARTSRELTNALEQSRVLRGLVSICAVCKKVREGGQWRPVEVVLRTKGQLDFSHSYCDECADAILARENLGDSSG